LKFAVTERLAVMLTVQVLLVPVQAPFHPVNFPPRVALAVNVTDVPLLYGSVQSLPQLMPAGDDVTVPFAADLPALVTVSRYWLLTSKLAVTALAAVMLTVQVLAAPVQAPLHPANREPAAGEAVRVTDVPLSYDSEQSLPQVMPTGDDVTVPEAASM